MAVRFALCLLLASFACAQIAPLHRANRALPSSYIVKLKIGADVGSMLDKLSRDIYMRNDVVLQDTFEHVFNGFVAKLTERAVQYIRELEDVEYVSENGVIGLPRATHGRPRLRRFDHRASSSHQWAMDRIDQRFLPLDGQYNPPNHGENVEIWVMDTGIRATHQEFAGRSVRIAYDIDNAGGDDPWGHGTLCTSVAAGNVYGAANRANIVVAKVIGHSSMGTWAAVMKALDIMAQTATKPAVVTVSLGEDGQNKPLEDAFVSIMDRGFTVAVAAGNENNDACASYPSNFQRVITVGSSTKTDTRWYYSNYGMCVDIFAPGKDITGATIGSDYATDTVSGTSEATPIVAGAAAILLSTQTGLSHDQVKAQLISNATPDVLQEPLPTGSPNLLLYVG